MGYFASIAHNLLIDSKAICCDIDSPVADGQRYEWKKLRLAKRQPKRRIMLLRKGWGIFGPLPVGGKYHDLEQAKTAIARFYQMGEESE